MSCEASWGWDGLGAGSGISVYCADLWRRETFSGNRLQGTGRSPEDSFPQLAPTGERIAMPSATDGGNALLASRPPP